MKTSRWIAASLLAVGAAFAQAPAEPLIKHTFAEDAAGWIPVGNGAKVVIFHDPALGAPTTGALRLNYQVQKGEFNGLYLPTPFDSLKTAQSIKFSVRADQGTVIAVALQEEEEGRYVAVFHAPKDGWQPVELSVHDFALAMEKDDPKDPNAKLDLERVTGIFIGDLSQIFASIEDPKAKDLFEVKPGPHTLYLDDFTVSSTPVAPSTASAGADVRIDSFAHPQLAWYGLGGVKMSRASGTPLEGAALKADYRQAPGKPIILTRNMMPWVLTQSKSLAFDAASAQASKLIVQVEETEGGKYNATVDVPAGSQAKHFDLPFADFKASDDAKDPSGKLEVGKIKQITFIDATGMLQSADRDNTLWINNLTGVAGK
ncbi:MAG: hypothetical protein ACO1SV_26430 [Fimbriimonas sp.]